MAVTIPGGLGATPKEEGCEERLDVGNALMIFVAFWLSFATLGLSLLVVPAMWIASIAYSAYCAPDQHGAHPWLHVWKHRWAHGLRGHDKPAPAKVGRKM